MHSSQSPDDTLAPRTAAKPSSFAEGLASEIFCLGRLWRHGSPKPSWKGLCAAGRTVSLETGASLAASVFNSPGSVVGLWGSYVRSIAIICPRAAGPPWPFLMVSSRIAFCPHPPGYAELLETPILWPTSS